MRKQLISLLLSLFLFGLCQSYAQNDIRTKQALARQAQENGENKKAIAYYEELYDQTFSESYYQQLFSLYIEEEDFKSAEKIAKKRFRKFSERAELIVDRGYVAEKQKDMKSADDFYKEAIDQLKPDQQSIRIVANQFIRYQNFKWAEKAFLEGRKITKDDQLFRFELANVYAQQGKTTEMIEEYLTILSGNDSYLQTVQNIFQRVLHPDPEGKQMENLKNQLLKRVQKSPGQKVFPELLVWLYIQDKNFYGAFIQAKAIDQRENEYGKRLFSLGQLSLSNEDFETAEKSFQYVIDLGDESPYYLKSRMKLLETLKTKVTASEYEIGDLKSLRKNYKKTIKELGKSSFTLPLIRDLSNLNAFYLDSVELAITQLEDALTIGGISKQVVAEVKLDLADLMLLKDEVWEASLLYSQVEKDFKYDQLGEIAKFKNAKIAFYTGDFYWAQAQLDVLKGSTSKLIANDALQLSLLITDNVGKDSIQEPLQMFAVADLLIFKKDFEKANKILDSIPTYFPGTSLKDEILFTKYKISYEQRNYEEAATHLRSILAEHAEDIIGDDALFALAKLEEEKFKNTEKAMELYKQLITTFPASLFVVESRKRFRALRGDSYQEEIN